VPVSKENYLDVWVLLYNLDQEHNKTRWQFQLIEPHVFTEAAVPLLKDWNRGYTKKVVLHDINRSVRALFDCLQSVAVSMAKMAQVATSPASTQPTVVQQSQISAQLASPITTTLPLQ
jgi:hypothetical protein